MAAVSALSISKRGAIALARKWDQRFALLDPAATRDWSHIRDWQETVRAIRQPWTITPDGRTVEPDAPDSWLRILGLV
jgi:hypothetical protein